MRCFGDDKGGIVTKAPTLPRNWEVLLSQPPGVSRTSLLLLQVQSIAVGDSHSCLISRDTSGSQRQTVVSSGNSSRVVQSGGNVTCWGDDKFGRWVHGARA